MDTENMADPKINCAPPCAPNVATPILPQPCFDCDPPVDVSFNTCAGTGTATVDSTVQTVPHPDAVQRVELCPPETTSNGRECDGTLVPVVTNGVMQTVPHPDFVQRVELCDPREFDSTILCAPDGTRVVTVTTYAAVTGVPTTNYYNLDGTPYAGDPTQLGTCDTDLESDAKTMCDNGVTTFLRWFVKENGEPTGAFFDTTLAGAPYAPGPNVTFGECAAGCVDCETIVLCDDPGIANMYPFTPLPGGVGGNAGTLSNGVTYTRAGAAWIAPPLTDFYEAKPAGISTWNFSETVDVEFRLDIEGLTTADDCFVLPVGVEVISIAAGVTWDANARTLCSQGLTGIRSSFFRLEDVASFSIERQGVPDNASDLRVGGIVVTAHARQFLRTICRDCTGAIVGVPTDTALDATTPYAVVGTVGTCPTEIEDDTPNCDQFIGVVCYAAADPVPPAYTTARFDENDPARPGCFVATGIDPDLYYLEPISSFQYTYEFDSTAPSNANFSAAELGGPIDFTLFVPPIPLLPANTGPAPYVGTAVQNGITITFEASGGVSRVSSSGLRLGGFRTDKFTFSSPVTWHVDTQGFGDPVQPYFERLCDVIAVGANTEIVGNTLQAHILRNCETGVLTYINPLTGEVLDASALTFVSCETQPDCCQPVQVCIAEPQFSTFEFISNEGAILDGSIDPVWQWTPNQNGLPENDPQLGPAAAATWYPMYRPTTYPAPRWTITDTDPDRQAFWITPHPNSGTLNQGQPGEGPSLVGNASWFGRASFNIPADVDLATLKIEVTVLNADQMTTGFSLNNAAWQQISPPFQGFNQFAPEFDQPFTFGPSAIPGAQIGTNFLYMRVRETVPGAGNAGVIAHLKATYEIADREFRSWTMMVCCDGTRYFYDEDGARQETLPTGFTIVPCESVEERTKLTAQHKLLAAGQSWGAADVLGTLTSVQFQVLSGTANVIDADGTAANGLPAGLSSGWAVEDENVLTGPQVITAVGGQTYVHWTQRE